jgi:transposase InsO family protein
MSKARLVILSVVVEGRSQADTARLYGVSPGWVSKLVARYRQEGDAAFEPKSRRPNSSPNALDTDTVELIIKLRKELTADGLDNGPHTVAWHLQRDHGVVVSPATIWRHLKTAGLVTPQPRKRPKASYVRFQGELPNEMWQSDFTHWRLADGSDVELLAFLDDCSRYALSVTAHQPVTGDIVTNRFLDIAASMGFPASILTDNGMVYTTRLSGGKGGRNRLERTLQHHRVVHKHSRPNHPTTCGKVERFHQTLKKWLTAQPEAATLEELQRQLDRFVDEYNNRRPHSALGRKTPASRYDALPKATPTESNLKDHYRVRHDIVGDTGTVTLRHAGKLHHIGIGRTHARTHITMLIRELDIHIIDTETGEVLRHLTLNPNQDYQPQHHNETPEP